MKTDLPPSPRHCGNAFKRLTGATLICILILAMTIPNLGSAVDSGPSSYQIKYGWPDVLWITIVVAPLLLIYAGAARSGTMEMIGWMLLLSVFALTISR